MKIGNKIRFLIITLFYILIITSCKLNANKTYDVNYYIDNELITSIKLEEGKKLELNKYKIYIEEKNCYLSQYLLDIMSDNQQFDCWYTNNNYSDIVENEIVKENTNLYGRIIDKEYTINFVTNCDYLIDSIKIKHGNEINSLPTPSKKQHTFIGWYIDNNLTIPFKNDTLITKDITLYAKWEEIVEEPIKYTITFNVNGGSEIDNILVEENNVIDLNNIKTIKDDYKFIGWYSDINLTTPYDYNTVVNCDITLYAKWEELVKHTIEFNTNGGSVISSIKVIEGTKVNQLEEPIKDGYTFGGWFIDEELLVSFDYNEEINSNLTLYAKWNEVINYSDFFVHFLQLGNNNAGDCIYIKAGDEDILIDGGSRESSLKSITNYVDQYCDDGILEYVIVTHAHQDHIACFAAENGIFDKYEVKTIIDFAMTDATTNVYENYLLAREEEIEAGAIHYDANECVKGLNGAQKMYQITNDISFEILEHKYYYSSSSDENNYSVCVMFKHVNSYFLFTGDLEEDGEKSLVQLNDLPEVELYKAGHHGSKTSSTAQLLEIIKPKVVAVCCCAGTDEYTRITDNQFPTQDFINRVAKYTNKIYVPLVATYTIATATSTWGGVSKGKQYLKRTGFKPLNGDIVVTSIAGVVSVKCSNNDIILKDSEWFNATITLNGQTRKMRTWPSNGV